MARLMPLSAAVEEVVRNGDRTAFEGFTHLIPYAAGHETIRQQRKDLTLVRMTPDILYDQMIGMGGVNKMMSVLREMHARTKIANAVQR